MTDRSPPYLEELQGNVGLLLASAIGLTAGMTATMFYSLGAFIPPLQAEFGWSRGDISLGASFLTIAIFITGTAAGRLCDRYGAALVGAGSLVLYGLAVILMALLVKDIVFFWAAYFVIAIVGVGSTPIVLVRPITTFFMQARGIALGIALTGAGIAGFWVPRLVAIVTELYGWREAYMALALIAILAAPVVWMGFRGSPGGNRDAQAAPGPGLGISHVEARRIPAYWLLSLMALTMALGIAGVIVHLIPLFTDLGAGPVEAAKIASIMGIASVVGRLGVGVVLDHLPCTLVSIAVLALAAAGILLLWGFGLQYALLATLLIGLAAGAEIDLLSYLTVTFFGPLHYGAIYGWQYSVFALGYGFSPYFVGVLYGLFNGYQVPLLGSALLLGFAAVTCLWLPKAIPGRQLLSRP